VAVEGVVGPASSATAGPTAAGPAKPALPPLSAGWTEHKTPEGRPYYYHAATKKSTWERPGAARPGADDAAKQYSIPEDRASSGDESESEEEDAPVGAARSQPRAAGPPFPAPGSLLPAADRRPRSS